VFLPPRRRLVATIKPALVSRQIFELKNISEGAVKTQSRTTGDQLLDFGGSSSNTKHTKSENETYSKHNKYPPSKKLGIDLKRIQSLLIPKTK
jgi:hypothetical protein